MKLIPIFKKHCLICQNKIPDQRRLCSDCCNKMEDLKLTQTCQRCAQPLKQIQAQCGACLMQSPHFTETHAIWRYESLSSYLIQRLKFNADFNPLPFLVDELATYLKTAYADRSLPEVIIPVPLHYFRLLGRGFNQSQELGKRLAQCLSLKFNAKDLHKQKSTRSQLALPKVDRTGNLQSAFKVHRSLPYHSVAIVDDVMTTGATANEIAKTLKAAGVQEVHVWVLARAIKTK